MACSPDPSVGGWIRPVQIRRQPQLFQQFEMSFVNKTLIIQPLRQNVAARKTLAVSNGDDVVICRAFGFEQFHLYHT